MRHKHYGPPTTGLPHTEIPRHQLPRRVPGVVDLIKTAIATKAKELDALAAPDAHKTVMADLSRHDRQRATRLMHQYHNNARWQVRLLKQLDRMGLHIESRYGRRPRLTVNSSVSRKLREAFTATREARISLLRTLYTSALEDTLGMTAANAREYLQDFVKSVSQV